MKQVHLAVTWMLLLTVMALAAGCAAEPAKAAKAASPRAILQQQYDLAGQRSPDPHYYVLETKVISYAEDGTRTLDQTYKLHLSATGPDQYVCRRFTVKLGTEPEVRIPSLDGWSYAPKGEMDEKGQVFGIEHSKFANLADANGRVLPPQIAYGVYNSFIDFHGFCDAYARPTTEDKGVQDLKQVGQRIVHAAAYSEPPVNLPGFGDPGSKFKHGEVTMEFKGLSQVDGAPCALLGFDSGESSFVVIIKPMPNMQVNSVGSSHYKGDIYLDLASKWPRKVELTEMVVAKSTMGEQNLGNMVVERFLTIRAVSKGEFEKD